MKKKPVGQKYSLHITKKNYFKALNHYHVAGVFCVNTRDYFVVSEVSIILNPVHLPPATTACAKSPRSNLFPILMFDVKLVTCTDA